MRRETMLVRCHGSRRYGIVSAEIFSVDYDSLTVSKETMNETRHHS